MEKTLIAFLFALSFYSCTKCGTCHFEQVTGTYPQTPGYPITTSYDVNDCGDDYKTMKDFTTTESKTTSGSTIIIVRTTKKYCNDN